MLIGIFLAVSLGAALLVCALAGSFAGGAWLWLLPCVLVGSFLVLAALWFVMILLMSKAVDMEAEKQKDSRFYRTVAMLTVNALVPILRIKVITRGLEKTPKDGRFLLVCNHLHDTDPVVLLWAFPKCQLAFISKRENDKMPIVGPFLRMLLCQPINRENDREALKTILRCIQLIREDEVSVGVFPEGYIRDDHLLYPFRGGVFKIAQKANVPVVVCTLRNTYQIYKNIKTWTPTTVELHLVGVISVEEMKGRTAVDIAHQAHEMMAQDLGPELVLPETPGIGT